MSKSSMITELNDAELDAVTGGGGNRTGGRGGNGGNGGNANGGRGGNANRNDFNSEIKGDLYLGGNGGNGGTGGNGGNGGAGGDVNS